MLAYRIYRDQQRGWRLTSPNLEQTGLLRIEYDGLADCCADEEEWIRELPAWFDPDDELTTAIRTRRWFRRSPQDRERIAKMLLDFMRRELAIKVDVLDSRRRRSGLKQRSNQRLTGVVGDRRVRDARVRATLYPRSRVPDDAARTTSTCRRAAASGCTSRRRGTFPLTTTACRLPETERIIAGLLEALRVYGLVEQVA